MNSLIKIIAIGLFVSAPVLSFSLINCECGSHETGIVGYVAQGPGCCSSAASAAEVIHHYDSNEVVWQYSHSEPIAGSEAQDICCRNS